MATVDRIPFADNVASNIGLKQTFGERIMNETIPLGAHIYVWRLGYKHHGIYVGRQEVVHYSGFSRFLDRDGRVEKVSLEAFCRQKKPHLVRYDAAETIFSPEEVVQRALSCLGANDYDLLTNNCEHFANWCVTGRARSQQVTVAATTIALTVGSAVIRLLLQSAKNKQK